MQFSCWVDSLKEIIQTIDFIPIRVYYMYNKGIKVVGMSIIWLVLIVVILDSTLKRYQFAMIMNCPCREKGGINNGI